MHKSLNFNELLLQKQYIKVQEELLKNYQKITPTDLINNEDMKYLPARACCIIISLDKEIISEIERIQLSIPQIIALGGGDRDCILSFLKQMENGNLMTPGMINEKIITNAIDDEIQGLLSFDKFTLSHIGSKAQQFGCINKREQGIILTIANYYIGKKNFTSYKQQKFFWDTLKKIHQNSIALKPCSKKKECDLCQKAEVILNRIFKNNLKNG